MGDEFGERLSPTFSTQVNTMAKITKQYLVTFEIDTEQAQGWKDGKYDHDSYPNWDINYRHEEGPSEFADAYIQPIRDLDQYSGITIEVKEKRTIKATLCDVELEFNDPDDVTHLETVIGVLSPETPYDFNVMDKSGMEQRVYQWLDDVEDFQEGIDLGDGVTISKVFGEPYESTEVVEI